MLMPTYSLHSTLSPPFLSSATMAVAQTSRWLSCGRCQMLSNWYRIGRHNNKKYRPITYNPMSVNIAQYPITQCQYRSNSMYDVSYNSGRLVDDGTVQLKLR